MKITILYFATLRSLLGYKQEDIDIPRQWNVAELRTHLANVHTPIKDALPSAIVSINREFAFANDKLAEGDEVGFFPPVSGGQNEESSNFSITEHPLDLNGILEELIAPETGAACVFSGIVRGKTTRGEPFETSYLEYEAYPPMAEEKMRQVAAEIRTRWPTIIGISIVQRIGRLDPGTPTVLIACTAGHRDTGVFEAARYGIDRLKQIVPIWKKEVGPDGEGWIEGDYHPTEEDQGQ